MPRCAPVGTHEVLAQAQAAVAEAPLRERRWALLALAQYQSGRQGEALRTLHRARTVLVTELGLDPGPDLVALEQAILRQDPALAVPPAAPDAAAVCPYLGLFCYDIDDAETFFGRDVGDRRVPAPAGERAGCWRSSGRRDPGSRRWSGPASPRRSCAAGRRPVRGDGRVPPDAWC